MRKRVCNNQKGEAEAGVMAGIGIGVVCLLAWFTHLYVCFTAAKWGFLIAGAIFLGLS